MTGTHNYTCSRCGYRGHAIIQLVEILAVCQRRQLSPLVDIKIIHITTGGKNNSLKQSGEFQPLSSSERRKARACQPSQYIQSYLLASDDFGGMMKLEILAATALVSTLCIAARLKLKTRSCQTETRECAGCDLKGEPWWCSLIGADLRDANLKMLT